MSQHNFLSRLREETSTLHKALEQTGLSVNLLSEGLTRKDYTRYLSAMAGAMEWYDIYILPMLTGMIPDAGDRTKATALVTDLNYLDGGNGESVIPFEPPVIASRDAAMGAAYVVEGSTLGGQYILKHVGPKLQLDASGGASYFAGYGPQTGLKWKSFQAALTAFAESGNQQEIVEGANKTFESILRHFNKHDKATIHPRHS